MWLIPFTQRKSSKPASDFCSLLSWGKCLGHEKSGLSSILYHLPLFPGSCLHPALPLGCGKHRGCLREPSVFPLTIHFINQPLREDGCKCFLSAVRWLGVQGFSMVWTAVVAKCLYYSCCLCCSRCTLHQLAHPASMHCHMHVDKLSRACNWVPLNRDGNLGPELCFLTGVLWHLWANFTLSAEKGHWGEHQPLQRHGTRNTYFSNGQQYVLKQVGYKSSNEAQIPLLINEVPIWDSDIFFYLSRVSERIVLGYYFILAKALRKAYAGKSVSSPRSEIT